MKNSLYSRIELNLYSQMELSSYPQIELSLYSKIELSLYSKIELRLYCTRPFLFGLNKYSLQIERRSYRKIIFSAKGIMKEFRSAILLIGINYYF